MICDVCSREMLHHGGFWRCQYGCQEKTLLERMKWCFAWHFQVKEKFKRYPIPETQKKINLTPPINLLTERKKKIVFIFDEKIYPLFAIAIMIIWCVIMFGVMI